MWRRMSCNSLSGKGLRALNAPVAPISYIHYPTMERVSVWESRNSRIGSA